MLTKRVQLNPSEERFSWLVEESRCNLTVDKGGRGGDRSRREDSIQSTQLQGSAAVDHAFSRCTASRLCCNSVHLFRISNALKKVRGQHAANHLVAHEMPGRLCGMLQMMTPHEQKTTLRGTVSLGNLQVCASSHA